MAVEEIDIGSPQHPCQPFLRSSFSRRRLLQVAAASGAASFLATNGLPGLALAQSEAPTAGASDAPPTALPVTAVFRMAAPAGYIDKADDGSLPSLDRFTAETGIAIDYQEVIDGEEDFFASDLSDALSSGGDTGWDIVVLTDWLVQRLAELGWLTAMDTSAMTNYPANLRDVYRTRAWNPGNVLAAPFQSGMTGIGFDRRKTGALDSLDVLFDDQFAGQVGYLDDMRDAVGLSALRLGLDPATLTQAQFDAALAAIAKAVKDGVVRKASPDGYLGDLATGRVVVSMAWSADVETLLAPNQTARQAFEWALATQGGMLWTDNMVIPKGAQNAAEAQTFIDWYYLPANAAGIEAAVNFVCPVQGSQEAMMAIDPALAADPLIFPTAEMMARLYQFRDVDIATAKAWTDAFDAVMPG